MASKGRKAQAKAAAGLNAVVSARPLRAVLPSIGLNSVNGANAQNLGMYRLRARPLTAEELAAWGSIAAAFVGLPNPAHTADEALRELVKDFPASLTLLPADPDQDWASAAEWLATTGAPNYTPAPGREVRGVDPEKTAQGATPLLAALALLEDRIVKKIWAHADGMPIPAGDARIQYYGTVAAFYKSHGVEFE